jgi:nitrogen regulatory protein PII
MHKLIVAIVRHEVLEKLITVLKEEDFTFMYSEVEGFCKEVNLYHKDIQKRIRIEIHADETEIEKIKKILFSNASCGMEGDGCLSIYNIEEHMGFYKEKE